jgi:uncharacterized membrane protein
MIRMRFLSISVFIAAVAMLFIAPVSGRAQESQPTSTVQPLLIYTSYPSQIIGFGEMVDLPLKLRGGVPENVGLAVENLPDGWTATFRGGSQIVESAYVNGLAESSVDLRLEPPADVKAGKYDLKVMASGEAEKAELPVSITIKEKLPPRLSLTVNDLPEKQGTPSSTFNYTANLKNEGGDDLVVTLSATQPQNMQVTIQNAGQDANQVDLPANATANLTIKAEPLVNLEAGQYPFTVQAIAGDVKAELDLIADVVGEGNLTVSAPDGRLSADAITGQENPVKVVLANNGTAPLRGIELSSSEPSGWSVTFDQTQIAEIPAGQQAEVTARIKPADKAVAGDYVVTINARPLDSKQESAQFRITVRTSTLWGVAGIGLIALAVAVVGVAVVRFGRR